MLLRYYHMALRLHVIDSRREPYCRFCVIFRSGKSSFGPVECPVKKISIREALYTLGTRQ